jgi:hypothetical protein
LARRCLPTGGAAVLLAVIGFAMGNGSSPGRSRATVIPIGTTATLRVNDATERISTPPGAGVLQARAFRPSSGPRVVTGTARPGSTGAIAAGALATALEGARAQVVPVGRIEAVRYDGMRLGSFSARTAALVLPTTKGTALVLRDPGNAAAGACDRAFGTLRPRAGIRALELAPTADYTRHLASVLFTYERRRASAASQLAGAGHAAGQAHALRRIAAAAGGLAHRLDRLSTSQPAAVGAQAAVAAAARRLQRAATRLAAAADDGHKAAFGTAHREFLRADRALVSSIRALRLLPVRRGP